MSEGIFQKCRPPKTKNKKMKYVTFHVDGLWGVLRSTTVLKPGLSFSVYNLVHFCDDSWPNWNMTVKAFHYVYRTKGPGITWYGIASGEAAFPAYVNFNHTTCLDSRFSNWVGWCYGTGEQSTRSQERRGTMSALSKSEYGAQAENIWMGWIFAVKWKLCVTKDMLPWESGDVRVLCSTKQVRYNPVKD